MHTNRLIHEKSPYLLQHAHNPVDWYAWGQDAFDKSQSEGKPIFLSIGYSTCHWCHVMERESFENEGIAAVLNRHFVPIKVDREERPDVDRIYMQFVQATTGGGGWPMSVWLTPDLKPFFGGTYFPPDSKWGRPGFRQVLEQLAGAWQQDRERIVQSAREVVEQLESHSGFSDAGRVSDEGVLQSGFFQFRRAFDARLGGFGQAPKFPRPSVHNFLLRYAYRDCLNKGSVRELPSHEAVEMVLVTLREMARGGMNDQIGGGFHRYSVDDRWFVPHFEKMLYDQAQLAVSYLEAYQITGNEELAGTARSIFEYVLRDMTDKDGGFYSAEDADSAMDPANPKEKGEGAFYIWTAAEIEAVLGQPLAAWFAYRYGVEPDGNVSNDPHGEFTRRNILYERYSVEETANRFGETPEKITASLAEARCKLFGARSTRPRPHLDDKILTAWNGLMISAFAKGAAVLQDSRYLDAADRAASFVIDRMYDRGGNVLLRRHREGESAIPGFLDDYAFFVHGLLDLYEAGFDERWLRFADLFTRRMGELFEDRAGGAFFSSAEGDASLVMRMKDDYDGAEPSGNSIAVLNLLRLSHVTGNDEYLRSAERTLAAFDSRLKQSPSAVPQMMAALIHFFAPPEQVVLAGPGDELKPFRAELGRRFLPFHTVLFGDAESPFEALRNMPPMHGRPTAYVCENFACKMPVYDAQSMAELLQ